MDDNIDAKRILFVLLPEGWKRLPGRPHITWLKTVQIPWPYADQGTWYGWLRIVNPGICWQRLVLRSLVVQANSDDDDDVGHSWTSEL